MLCWRNALVLVGEGDGAPQRGMCRHCLPSLRRGPGHLVASARALERRQINIGRKRCPFGECQRGMPRRKIAVLALVQIPSTRSSEAQHLFPFGQFEHRWLSHPELWRLQDPRYAQRSRDRCCFGGSQCQQSPEPHLLLLSRLEAWHAVNRRRRLPSQWRRASPLRAGAGESRTGWRH